MFVVDSFPEMGPKIESKLFVFTTEIVFPTSSNCRNSGSELRQASGRIDLRTAFAQDMFDGSKCNYSASFPYLQWSWKADNPLFCQLAMAQNSVPPVNVHGLGQREPLQAFAGSASLRGHLQPGAKLGEDINWHGPPQRCQSFSGNLSPLFSFDGFPAKHSQPRKERERDQSPLQ